MDCRLGRMCLEAATQSRDAVEIWRRQWWALKRMPPYLAEILLHRLLGRRLLFPSLLEDFKYCIEEVDLSGKSSVDEEWMAYLGSIQYLHSLKLADCYKINSSAIWHLTGLAHLKELDLSRCSELTDSGIRHLTSIPVLEKLWIPDTGVTAEGVALLASLTNLSVLDLAGLPVTDSALSSLQVLNKLEHLDLWGSEISNEGAAILKNFPKLKILNLARTKVTKLPNLSSLAWLNMSSCTITSLFEEDGDKACLTKLFLTGAALAYASEVFLYVEASSIYILDLANSFLQSFCFLSRMYSLTCLSLRDTSLGDDSVEHIARIGANLVYLNLSITRISSAGVRILAGHVPKLEIIVLSRTLIDDSSLQYISMMPSLKVISLSETKVKGFIKQTSGGPRRIPSLSAISNLTSLERLYMDDIYLDSEALRPLSALCELKYISLRNAGLTDQAMHHLSSLQKLETLDIRDNLIYDDGFSAFSPPPNLALLDIRGRVLLSSGFIFLFCQKHPQIRVRHKYEEPPDIVISSYTPPRMFYTSQNRKRKGNQRFPELADYLDVYQSTA